MTWSWLARLGRGHCLAHCGLCGLGADGGAGTCHSGARVLALSGPLCSPVSPPRQQLGSARLISWAGLGLAWPAAAQRMEAAAAVLRLTAGSWAAAGNLHYSTHTHTTHTFTPTVM